MGANVLRQGSLEFSEVKIIGVDGEAVTAREIDHLFKGNDIGCPTNSLEDHACPITCA